jgi:hypothetical protein
MTRDASMESDRPSKLPESDRNLEPQMSTDPNPYERTSPVESDINSRASLVVTRVISAYSLIFWLLRFARDLLWRIQAFA